MNKWSEQRKETHNEALENSQTISGKSKFVEEQKTTFIAGVLKKWALSAIVYCMKW